MCLDEAPDPSYVMDIHTSYLEEKVGKKCISLLREKGLTREIEDQANREIERCVRSELEGLLKERLGGVVSALTAMGEELAK